MKLRFLVPLVKTMMMMSVIPSFRSLAQSSSSSPHLLVAAIATSVMTTKAMTTTTPATTVSASTTEGSITIQVSPSLATEPGSQPGFFNPRRRVGRDMVVLSIANQIQLLHSSLSSSSSSSSENENTKQKRPIRVLDAMCATGMQGLRVAVESPILLVKKWHQLQEQKQEQQQTKDVIEEGKDNSIVIFPGLHVTLNDMDPDAIGLTTQNVKSVFDKNSNKNMYNESTSTNTATTRNSTTNTTTTSTTTTTTTICSSSSIQIQQRVAQALLFEETFDVTILDPCGSTVPHLDAAMTNAPHGGLIEICATDVDALYGSRPTIAKRHYGTFETQHQQKEPSTDIDENNNNKKKKKKKQNGRPPTYRERGIRRLLAAVAQAAGRHDRGIQVLWSVSTDHYCLVSVKVKRRGGAADQTAAQVGRLYICPTCGSGSSMSTTSSTSTIPPCGCTNPGSISSEGPLWTGPLYDADTVQSMADLANTIILDQEYEDDDVDDASTTSSTTTTDTSSAAAINIISKETKKLLNVLREESRVDDDDNRNAFFYRRPGFAANVSQPPKLDIVLHELKQRGFRAARTHFDSKALRSNASPHEFDEAVRNVCCGGGEE